MTRLSDMAAMAFIVLMNWYVRSVIWGAYASRVLVLASRQDELPCRIAGERVRGIGRRTLGKFVSAGRRNQHAGRVCSPDSVIARSYRDRRLDRRVRVVAFEREIFERKAVDVCDRRDSASSPAAGAARG